MLEGLRRKEIAFALDRSIHTIDDHVRAIYLATGIRDRAMLLVAARDLLRKGT